MQIYYGVYSEHSMLTRCAGFLKWHNPQSAGMPTKRQRSRTGCPMARGRNTAPKKSEISSSVDKGWAREFILELARVFSSQK